MRTMLIVVVLPLILLALLAAGCVPAPTPLPAAPGTSAAAGVSAQPTEVVPQPTAVPPQPTAVPYTTTVTLSEALTAPGVTLADTRIYPIRKIIGAATLADLAVEVEDFGMKIGLPRFALGHVVTDVNKPAPFTITPTTTWVLLTAAEGLGGAVTWRESVVEPAAGLLQHTGSIEMSVIPADVITITASQNTADLLTRMLEAQESRRDPASGMGLFVDFLLVEQGGAGDTPAWVLYQFVPIDEGGAGKDWLDRLCRSLRCSSANDSWTRNTCRFFGCAH